MTEQLNISKDLHKQYFWDVDITNFDVDRSKRLVIERVFELGTSTEVKLVISYYGIETVVDVLKKLNYIDPKTLNFVSAYFKVSLESFKCYRRKQSIQQHWDS